MRVVATAGHVDHGKSTLLRALTGMEPDRWAEERRRGMTIDLGFAWTALPSGRTVAFVDVPGHARFVQNMLAGLGPVPAVALVVAADEGWMAQTAEHADAIAALGVAHGLLVISKADLADPAPALAQARAELAGTPLAAVPWVAVSAATGAGLAELTAALDALAAALPDADGTAAPRLWVDRSFTIRGAGTVVTGTLPEGTLRVGDELELAPAGRRVRVRALQSLGQPVDAASGVARVAVNLRGVPAGEVRRGDALVAPGTWRPVSTADVRLDRDPPERPGGLTLHAGSAAVPVRLRPLAGRLARLALSAPLPLRVGDRVLLRDAGGHRIVAGADVLDPDPPPLARRGAASARAGELDPTTATFAVADELRRRGHARLAALAGYAGRPADRLAVPADAVRAGDLLLARERLEGWAGALAELVRRHRAARPLEPGLPEEEARRVLGLPGEALPLAVRAAGGLAQRDGRIELVDAAPQLPPPVAAAVRTLTERLADEPFAAPEAGELARLGLTQAGLAAAVRQGLLLRVGDVYLRPDAPQAALAALAALPAPFTVSDARQAWRTTRRVAVPLLEHLDATGRTRRVDGTGRVLA